MIAGKPSNRLTKQMSKAVFALVSLVLFLTFSTSPAFGDASDLVINEILVSNVSLMRDPDHNNFGGWIEIYNAGSSTVSLDNFTLTDDLNNPDKWTLPDQNIGAGC